MAPQARHSEPFRFLGMEFAPLSLPLERRLQTFAVFVHLIFFITGALWFLALCAYLFFYTTNWRWVPLLYFAWYFYDLNTAEKGGRNWTPGRNWLLSRYFAKFFPITLKKTVDLDPERSYLFGYHPHGLLSFGAYASFATNALGFNDLFPGITSRLITLPQNFMFPFTREFLLAHGLISSTKQSMEHSLSVGKGQANVLVVGGALEALNHGNDNIELVLKRRKGFVKLAIRFGRPLVPVFGFGENYLYDNVPNAKGSWLRTFQDWFEAHFAFAPAFFIGRGVLQYSWGIVPRRQPITVVVGAPVEVQQDSNPTKQQIEETHARYVKALVDLYKKYNPVYGQPNARLVILE